MANVITQLSRGTGPFTVLASAARTATPDTQEFDAILAGPVGLYLIVDVTAVALTGQITVKVSGVDRVSGATFDILTSAAITAEGTTVLHVGPGITAAANTQEDQHVPPVFVVTATHDNAAELTYSIGGLLCH